MAFPVGAVPCNAGFCLDASDLPVSHMLFFK